MLRCNNSTSTPLQADTWSDLMRLAAVGAVSFIIALYIGYRYGKRKYGKYKRNQKDVFFYKKHLNDLDNQLITESISSEYININMYEAEIMGRNLATSDRQTLQKCINNMQPNTIYGDINPEEHIYCEIKDEQRTYCDINPEEHTYCEIKDEQIDDSIAENVDISGTKYVSNSHMCTAEALGTPLIANNCQTLHSDISPEEDTYELIDCNPLDKNDAYTYL